MNTKSVLLIYHFFYPDTVVSAQLFSDLAEHLAAAGHQVTVFTGNRLIRSEEILSAREAWRDVNIERFSRPGFSQGNNFGRLFNSGILQLKWLLAFLKKRKEFDTVIIGTDPQFAYMMFPLMRLINRRVRLIHWVFDVYPEAILVNSPMWMKRLAALSKPFVPLAYRQVDVMADIGECMRDRLQKYRHRAQSITLTPWALVEPVRPPAADPELRRQLFGDAKLGILYSGTVGYAHDLEPFIRLARECRRRGIDAAFCFAGYGNLYQKQTAQLTAEDTNIRLAGFASTEELEQRLAAADIHLISLRKGWEGVVVPSKFFGALAIGRPVIFSGPEESCIARWCQKHQIGYLADDKTPDELQKLIAEPETLAQLRGRAFDVYQQNFSQKSILQGWDNLLQQ